MASTSTVLNVQGMSCNHCVSTVTKALNELQGVQSVNVDLKANTVTVSYDETASNLGQIKEAIEEAGYDVA